MGRLFIGLGIVLFIVAAVYMFVMVSGTDNELATSVFQTILCGEHESFKEVLGGYQYDSSTGTSSQSVSYNCSDSEGTERDVTLGTIGIIGGGFAIFLITGLVFTFVGTGMLVRNQMKSTMNYFQSFTVQSQQPTVIDLRDGGYQSSQFSQIPPEKREQVQQVLGQFGAMLHSGDKSLSERLEQLDDARNKGLISESEYQRVRQAILDSMDN